MDHFQEFPGNKTINVSDLLLNNLEQWGKYIVQPDEDLLKSADSTSFMIDSKKKKGVYYYPLRSSIAASTNEKLKSSDYMSVQDFVAETLADSAVFDSDVEKKFEFAGYVTLRKADLHGNVEICGQLRNQKNKKICSIYRNPHGKIKGMIPVIYLVRDNNGLETVKESYLIYFENRSGADCFFHCFTFAFLICYLFQWILSIV